jgi:hypothetical protein
MSARRGRCILHVGMSKTGSSSIQHSLHGLDDERFLYADLGGDPNHSLAIHSVFADDALPRHRLRADPAALAAYIAERRARLERAVAATGERTLLLSGEGIVRLEQHELAGLRDFLHGHFSESSVVAYVRPPAAYLTSAFQQRVKVGRVKSFKRAHTYRSYERLFAKFDAVFGRRNVSLWKFEPGAFPQGCVVRDFAARIGLELGAQRIVRRNDALSRPMIGLLYCYLMGGRQLGLEGFRATESNRMSQLLELDGTGFRLSPALVRPILASNAGDVAWMEQRLGETLQEELGDPRPGDVEKESDLLEPDADAVAVLRQVLAEEAPAGVRGVDFREVARLMHRLRDMAARAD